MDAARLLTIPRFARTYGISSKLARELVKSGDIESVLVGKRRRINAAWAERWSSGQSQDCQPDRREAVR